ncbi:MAG: CrcB family protein [Ornithinimicrobium sp.]
MLTVTTGLAVALGGAVGAVMRYGAGVRWGSLQGTFVVNAAGCALLGMLVALAPQGQVAAQSWWYALLATGTAGALTTWSTLAMQVYDLATRDRAAAVGYLMLSTGVGGLLALVPMLVWGH